MSAPERGAQRLSDYKRWHHWQVATDDIDPVYPVYRALGEMWGLDQEDLAWLCIYHVTYYHAGSALTVWQRYPGGIGAMPRTADALGEKGLLTLPTATERRAHRDVRQLAKHILALQETLGDDPLGWLGANTWSWGPLNDRITEVHGNGRWAAYKLAEMLQKVVGVPTWATDAGHKHSSGPRKGLNDLYEDLPEGNTASDVRELDLTTSALASWLGEDDIALVETSLCDFHSLLKGGYYLGHDIDALQEQLTSPKVDAGKDVWAARREVFPVGLRGEDNGWSGIRRELKNVYKTTGRLANVDD